MARFLPFLVAGLLVSSLSHATDRAARSLEPAGDLESDTSAAEAHMKEMYSEGIYFDPAEPGEPGGGVQEAVQICVDGSGWCLETTSYVDCNDWISSYGEEGTPSGISCYDVI